LEIKGENIMILINSMMATLHHIAAFTVAATLVYEFVAFRRNLTVEEARRILHVDSAYGISAGLLIVVGLLRVFYFEKGSAFYLNNTMYWIKMGLFLLAGLISIYPTVRFLKWRPALKENKAPEISDDEFKKIRLVVHLELACILLILFVAPMMARGIGA
jgi:putative membrane protein